MTTINLENGGMIGVYGNVEVRQGMNGWTVTLGGPVAKVYPPGTMDKLKSTTAISIIPDNLPGRVFYYLPGSDKQETSDYLQLPPGVHTWWVLDKEDAEPVK